MLDKAVFAHQKLILNYIKQIRRRIVFFLPTNAIFIHIIVKSRSKDSPESKTI